MALTRSMLRGMGLTDEQVGAIIDAHTETVDGLKEERNRYKEKAEKLPNVEEELTKLKEQLNSGDEWEDKYNKEHQAFEDYKNEVAGKEKEKAVKDAYRKLLIDNKVGDKHIDSIIKITDFGGMKLDSDGKLKDEDKLVESIKSDWAGFITTVDTKGVGAENPPKGSGKTMTKEEITNIKDTSERQKAIAENHELFGF